MVSKHNKEDRIMIDSKDILTLLSIPCEEVSDVEIISDTKEITYVDIELKDNRSNCPFCFQNNIVIKDYYKVKIKNSIIRKHKLYVEIRMRRYKCKCCNKTFKQNFNFYDNNQCISKHTKQLVQSMLMDRISMEYIAKELDINKKTVINILDSMPEPQRLKLPNVICLDEFHFSNANHKAGKYPCVISNPFNTELIDIVESRRKDYLIDYFQHISFKERNNVKYFISDMNETYRSIYKIFFKDAIHIVDHFHIIKLFTEAIQKIRIKIMKSYTSDCKEYKYLKKNWKLFLMKRYISLRLRIRLQQRGNRSRDQYLQVCCRSGTSQFHKRSFLSLRQSTFAPCRRSFRQESFSRHLRESPCSKRRRRSLRCHPLAEFCSWRGYRE